MLAFVVAIALHYSKLIKQVGSDEWLPSMLTVISQFFPERALFQITAALASSFHIAMVFIWYYLTRPSSVAQNTDGSARLKSSHYQLKDVTDIFSGKLPNFIFLAGIVRTIFLAGIIYIPLPDDHDTHDFCLAGYLLMTTAWFYGMLKFTSGDKSIADSDVMILSDEMKKIIDNFGVEPEASATLPLHNDDGTWTDLGEEKKSEVDEIARLRAEVNGRRNKQRLPTAGFSSRKKIAFAYASLAIPLVHYMIQHRVYRTAGSYSKYAIFEWVAIVLDVAFDAVSALEFEGLELRVVNAPDSLKEDDEEDEEVHREEGKSHYV